MESEAVPRRARARKYAPKHRDWMIKHVKMLEKNGFIRKNPSSRWSSPVLIVPKPGKRDEFRMTVDCMYANFLVQPVAGFLPILEVNFRQFPLAEESQEAYSFLTELGVFTPTRLIQRSTDSSHGFQAGMVNIFEDMLCTKTSSQVMSWCTLEALKTS